jgi:hypothetical protein
MGMARPCWPRTRVGSSSSSASSCAASRDLPCLSYLSRLRTRMERTGFPPDDPLLQLVNKAYDAVQHLAVHVHYLSCGSGVGRSSLPEESDDVLEPE